MAFVKTTQKFVLESNLLDLETGDSVDISKYLIAINVKEAYFENAFPLFVLEISCPEEIKDRIRDNDFQVSLRCYKYDYDSGTNQETEEDDNEIAMNEVVFDTVLKVYSKPYISSEMTQTNDDAQTSDQVEEKTSIPMFNCQLSTIPLEQIKINEMILNQVFVDAIPADVVVNLVGDTCGTDFYMEIPDNLKSEPEVIIPPMNLIPAIKQIQEVYGIYNYGIAAYFGVKEAYIFSPLKPKENPNNYFNISIEPTADTNDMGKYSSVHVDDQSMDCQFYLKAAPSFSSSKKIDSDSLGVTTVFNSYDNNFDLITRIVENESNDDTNKKRYFWNSYQNKFKEQSFLSTYRNSEGMTTLQLFNIDPSYFNPGTKVSIYGQKTGYMNGEYSIAEKTYRISTTDKKHWSSSVALSLLKIQ